MWEEREGGEVGGCLSHRTVEDSPEQYQPLTLPSKTWHHMDLTFQRRELLQDACLAVTALGTDRGIIAFQLPPTFFWDGYHLFQSSCSVAIKSLFALTVPFLKHPGGSIPHCLRVWNAATWSLHTTTLRRCPQR